MALNERSPGGDSAAGAGLQVNHWFGIVILIALLVLGVLRFTFGIELGKE